MLNMLSEINTPHKATSPPLITAIRDWEAKTVYYHKVTKEHLDGRYERLVLI